MSIIFFEGFETVGQETGSANASLTYPQLAKRMSVTPSTLDSTSGFVREGAGAGDLAWQMGETASSFLHTLEFPLPDSLKVSTGPTSPVITIGVLVHIPSTARTFSMLTLTHSGGFEPNIEVVNSTHLRVRVGSNVIVQQNNVFTPGDWHYLEWQTRADGTTGDSGTSEVSGTPVDAATQVNVTNTQMNRSVWSGSTAYSINDVARYKGEAFISLSSNLNVEPGTTGSELDWDSQGPEGSFTSEIIPISNTFFFEGQSDTLYTTDLVDQTSPVSFTPALNAANFLPVNGDGIFIGPQGLYDIRVNGKAVVSATGVRTMVSGDTRTLEGIIFSGTGVTAVNEDYLAYDNIYITTDDGTGQQGLLGPSRVITMPPDGDVTSGWTPSTTGDHADIVGTNDSTSTGSVSSDDNSFVDEYDTTDSALGTDDIYSVKAEAVVENITAGSPNLKLSIDSGASSDTQSTGIANTGQSEVVTIYSEDDPDGGPWDELAMDAATVKIQMEDF